jgi:hypothetical protein
MPPVGDELTGSRLNFSSYDVTSGWVITPWMMATLSKFRSWQAPSCGGLPDNGAVYLVWNGGD